jgi:hypothetical protein
MDTCDSFSFTNSIVLCLCLPPWKSQGQPGYWRYLGFLYRAYIFRGNLFSNRNFFFLSNGKPDCCFYPGSIIFFPFLPGIQLYRINGMIEKFGIDNHYQSVSRGVIDSRDIIYFLSVIFLFLFLTKTSLQSRKW